MNSDITKGEGATGYSLKEAGDFIERVNILGATAVVVGNISVRFPEPEHKGQRRPQMSAREIQEMSA